jgi:Xaa-Pro aminopeptidase
VVHADGDAALVTNLEPKKEVPAAVRTYTGYSIHKVFGREIAHDESVTLVREVLGDGPVGVEFEWISGGMMAAIPGATKNLTPWLIETRRRKMPDEIESMRGTAALASEGYSAIKQRLEPGMTELDAYRIIYEAIVTAAGTSVELNGDFACGVRAIGVLRRTETSRKGTSVFLTFFRFSMGTCATCAEPSWRESPAVNSKMYGHTSWLPMK